MRTCQSCLWQSCDAVPPPLSCAGSGYMCGYWRRQVGDAKRITGWASWSPSLFRVGRIIILGVASLSPQPMSSCCCFLFCFVFFFFLFLCLHFPVIFNFFFFLLTLCDFHIMLSNPTQSPSPCICPLPLHPLPPKQNRKRNLGCESCSVSQCATQCTLWSTWLYYIAVRLVRGLRLLLDHQYSILTWTPLRCPVVAYVTRYFSFGSVGLAPSHAPAVQRWGRYGGGPKPWIWAW